jgi:SAM-dependent methyltransferase
LKWHIAIMDRRQQQAAVDQTARWNGPAGHAWVEAQALLDQVFLPLEQLLVAPIAAGSDLRVLDVGCGTGSTTLAAARRLGAAGAAIGIDLSAPMVDAGRERATREGSAATFIRDNAQTHVFEPARFDLIISRFGVMFFDDPVAAFANLRRAAKPGGGLRVIAWRGPSDNPFMTTAERAAAPLLPNLPRREAGAPGQFAFAEPNRVRGILEDSDWDAIDIRPMDARCSFPETALNAYLARLGPLGTALRDADDRTRAEVIAAVRPAFDPFVSGADVCFTAACWMVEARSVD